MIKQTVVDVLAKADRPLTSSEISAAGNIPAQGVRVALNKMHAKQEVVREKIENSLKKGPSSIYTYRIADAQN